MLVVGVKSNLGCEAGCGVTVSCSDYGRIMLGLFSERFRIGRALELTFHLFWRNVSENFRKSFGVAGAIFGDIGGCHLLFRVL